MHNPTRHGHASSSKQHAPASRRGRATHLACAAILAGCAVIECFHRLARPSPTPLSSLLDALDVLPSNPASIPPGSPTFVASPQQSTAYRELAYHAVRADMLDLGARISERALASNVSESDEWVVRNHRPWYTRVLSEHAPSTTYTRIPWRAPVANWTMLNPSVVSLGKRGYAVLVRSSNFHVEAVANSFRSNYKTVDGGVVNTTYVYGTLSRSLHRTLAGPLHITGPAYASSPSSSVKGLEDAKLNQLADGMLTVSGNARDVAGLDGRPKMAVARLDVAAQSLTNMVVMSGGAFQDAVEKNWMPFLGSPDTWLYKLQHEGRVATVKMDQERNEGRPTLRNQTTATITPRAPSPHIAREFRGGSGLVPLSTGKHTLSWLGLVHEVSAGIYGRTYEHRFVQLSRELDLVAVSPPFFIMEPRTIEYGSSLAINGGDVVIGFGLRDEQAWLARVTVSDVVAMLERV